MKKLFALVALFFAFSLSSYAQEAQKEANPEVLAKNETFQLKKFLDLDENKTEGFYRLFVTKHKRLNNLDTAEAKEQLKLTIQAKIDASLDADQLQKLKANKELYEDLLN